MDKFAFDFADLHSVFVAIDSTNSQFSDASLGWSPIGVWLAFSPALVAFDGQCRQENITLKARGSTGCRWTSSIPPAGSPGSRDA